MSKIKVTLEGDNLIIKKKTTRRTANNIEKIKINNIENGREYISNILPTNKDEKNKIYLTEKVGDIAQKEEKEDIEETELKDEEETIFVYSNNQKINYIRCSESVAYKKIVDLKFKILKISLTKKRLKIKILAYIVNKYNLDIKNIRFYIDSVLNKKCKLKQYPNTISKIQMLKGKNIYTFKFDIKDIIQDESMINGYPRFCLNINGIDINYKVGKKDKKICKSKNKRYYKIPIKSIYVKEFSLHIRRTTRGNLVLVKRKIEDIEKTVRYKILENKMISFILYHIGKLLTKLRRKKINLFYEKFASKAEEGVYELCKMCEQSKKTKNYFVIDKQSKDYDKIKQDKNVVKKYSLKYYWLFYNTNCFIASEVPSHLNILRTNNKYFRRATYDKKFVFLQHGIIYLKNLGKTSVFTKGEEGESNYIIVSSEKERDVVVETLKYDEDQILKTGQGMYSKIDYKHINQNSDDIVAIMLTWKTYEEQLYNFEESSYYKNVVEMFNMLKKYIPQEKIIIIGHPKANELLKETDLGTSIWQEPVSKALEKSKLLITDYSSVCYNSFYQGAGVIFYQPDLEKYEAENGKLIPNDDEYIGKRAFNIEDLENIIKDTIQNQKINLDKVRTPKHEEIYKTINEFSDGKNIDRIYQELIRLKLI